MGDSQSYIEVSGTGLGMKTHMKNPRLLFLGGGPVYPDSIPMQQKYIALGNAFDGEIIAPYIGVTDIRSIGPFRLKTFRYWQQNSLVRNLYSFMAIIFHGLTSSLAAGRFDVVISPNPLTTGLAGWLLARLTGSRLVIEVNGNFESAFKFGRDGQSEITRVDRVKERISRMLISFSLRRADIVKLVYRHQLVPLNIGQDNIKTVAFPNYVPIEQFMQVDKADGKYVLLMGYPWFLKGADILIKAFNEINNEFPDYRLKIVGWCPEGREYYIGLADENPNIELLRAVEYDKVIELMANCSLYVLASRTDSSPRVLREAMASRKPIIAADIDGVPVLIKDGYNGLLFEAGSVSDLADKMREILSTPELAAELADNGYRYVQEHLSSKSYICKYQALIRSICEDEP